MKVALDRYEGGAVHFNFDRGGSARLPSGMSNSVPPTGTEPLEETFLL